MNPLVWIALLAGGAYLLTRSSSSPSSSSTCSPPQPTTVPPAVPGEYVAVAELWNDASCSTEGQPDVMPVTAQELAGMRLKVGGNVDQAKFVTPGHTGYIWVFDEHQTLVFAGRIPHGGVLEQVFPTGSPPGA